MGGMIKDNLPILAGIGAGLALPALFPALAGAGAAGAGAAGIGTTMPAWAGAASAGTAGAGTAAGALAAKAAATGRLGTDAFGGLAMAPTPFGAVPSTTTLPSILTNPWMRSGMQMFGRGDPRRHLSGMQMHGRDDERRHLRGQQDLDSITTPVEDNTAIIPKTDLAQLLPSDQADPRRQVPIPIAHPRWSAAPEDLSLLMGAYGGVMPDLGGGYQ